MYPRDGSPAAGESPVAREDAVVERVSALMGVINSAFGELVAAIGPVVADEVGLGPGVHTPAAWVAWRTGLSPAHARNLVRLAERAEELPVATAALVAGELSVDQAAEIARHVHAVYDHDATEVGRLMTVRQLRKALPAYRTDPLPAPEAGADPSSTETDPEPAEGEGAGGEQPKPTGPTPVPERSVSTGVDEHGWWAKIRLSIDEGAVVDQALSAIRDDLYRQARRDTPDDDRVRRCRADALVAMAEAGLAAGEARLPGADRYLVHLHYEANPVPGTPPGPGPAPTASSPLGRAPAPSAGPTPGPADERDHVAPTAPSPSMARTVPVGRVAPPTSATADERSADPRGGDPPEASVGAALSVHLGPRLPAALRSLVLCDPTMRAVEHRGGVPVNLGRRTRVVTARLRRLVEHRDGGCIVPGCSATVGIEIHHITHWEQGGATDTHNLASLCRRHHRLHHLDQLHIAGNADHPPGTPGALTVTDRWGRPLAPSATPAPGDRTRPVAARARTLGLATTPNPGPLGERLCTWGFHLNARRPAA